MTNKQKILIIDDEIHGINIAQAKEYAEIFFQNYSDTDSEVSMALDTFFQEEGKQFCSFLSEDRDTNNIFLEKVLLDNLFIQKAPKSVLEILKPLYSKHNELLQLKKVYQKAFPEDLYDVTFETECPAIDEAKQHSMIIIDLILSRDGKEESVTFLKQLSELNQLPSIILISSHFNDTTIGDQSEYFEETRLSAGLTTMSKEKLLTDPYEGKILQNLVNILTRQQEVSNQIRHYVFSWEKALNNAKEKTLNTIWKLDSLLLQSIYSDAKQDSQLFEDHIQNFLFREHLWHLEHDQTLSSSTKKLDDLFEKKQKEGFLWTNFVNVDSHRSLLTHYFFKNIKKEPLLDITFPKLKKNLLEYAPFGAVFSGVSSDKNKIYINITQACDLTDFIRGNKPDSLSLLLMCTDLINTDSSQSLAFESSKYKITDFYLNNKSGKYDIIPNCKKILSFSLDDFYKFVVDKQIVFEGTLRSDIATGLQQKVVANLIRPSEARSDRPGLTSAKAYLIKKDTQEAISFSNDVIQVLRKNIAMGSKIKEHLIILNRAFLELPLWVGRECGLLDKEYDKDFLGYFNSPFDPSKSQSLCAGKIKVHFKEVINFDDIDLKSFSSEKNNTLLFYYEKFQ